MNNDVRLSFTPEGLPVFTPVYHSPPLSDDGEDYFWVLENEEGNASALFTLLDLDSPDVEESLVNQDTFLDDVGDQH